MKSEKEKSRSALSEIADQQFFLVVCDPEAYETRNCAGKALLKVLAGMVCYGPEDMPEDEFIKLGQFVDDPDNWREFESMPSALIWDIGSEAGTKIHVYRLAHQ